VEKNYNNESLKQLVTRLRPFGLLKGEVVMILNLRPASVPALSVIVEDLASRFSEEKQGEILGTVAEILGQAEQPEGGEEEGDDVEM
jgi:hypothetical protein